MQVRAYALIGKLIIVGQRMPTRERVTSREQGQSGHNEHNQTEKNNDQSKEVLVPERERHWHNPFCTQRSA